MYPGFFGFHAWKNAHDAAHAAAHERRAAACGGWRGHHGGHGRHEEARWAGPHHDDGAGFGVRRPLRFLAHRLELDETQVAELARILNELKTERAQAEVDDRRTLTAFADAVAGASYDEPRAAQGADLRLDSHKRLRDAVLKALGQIHAILDEKQRAQLAYLIRTGTLTL